MNAKEPVKPDAKDDLKSLPLEEVQKQLKSSPEGLTQAEVQKRLTQYGPNEIEAKKTNQFLKFPTYLWGPIPWIIEAAVVGFWGEHEAGNAIEALKAKLVIKARGFRSLGVARAEGDGQWQFLGVLSLFDPPREDAKATIATAFSMGVKIKMVTGDGVNDAPALKKADCGIAVSGATDAARAAAAIVMLALLNDGAILSIAYDNVHYKDQPEAWYIRQMGRRNRFLSFTSCSPSPDDRVITW